MPVERWLGLDFEVSLSGADREQLLEAAGMAAKAEPETNEENTGATALPLTTDSRSNTGIVELELTASGLSNDPYSFYGSGKIRITEGHLGTIHIFGALSRLLARTGANFTTLRLDHAESQIVLLGEKLEFPNVVVTGSNAVVRANGYLNLPKKAIDLVVRLYYLEGSKDPLMAFLGGFFFKPFGNALEMNLYGTFDDSKWRFQFDPLKMFGPALAKERTDDGPDDPVAAAATSVDP